MNLLFSADFLFVALAAGIFLTMYQFGKLSVRDSILRWAKKYTDTHLVTELEIRVIRDLLDHIK
mgnify:CR=1 FL=1